MFYMPVYSRKFISANKKAWGRFGKTVVAVGNLRKAFITLPPCRVLADAQDSLPLYDTHINDDIAPPCHHDNYIFVHCHNMTTEDLYQFVCDLGALF
jgi:hypothetical protein